MPTTRALFAYGTLRLPLALLELPLFVLLPNLYGQAFGMDLTTVGMVLFGARLIDAVADPLIGAAIDRTRHRADFRRWIVLSLPLLVLGFAAMLNPPVRADALAWWLAAGSVLTYLAFSAVSISYQAWGACIGATDAERARVTTVRESFGLVGVLMAAALLTPDRTAALAAMFAGLALVSAVALRWAPAPHAGGSARASGAADHAADRALAPRVESPTDPARAGSLTESALIGWRRLRANPQFRWLLAVFMFNGVATAIPATLVLFYVGEVLGADSTQSASFLGVYFLAGALGMPAWLALARRFGLRNSWLLGMALAVLGFVWTLSLGRGDFNAFYAICIATGLALGADLAMPPALLAAAISSHGDGGRDEGAYFGLWNLATKLNLALAAGIALPALEWLRSFDTQGAEPLALPLAYAALPSALKLVAGGMLLLAPLPEHSRPTRKAFPGRSTQDTP